MIVQLFIYLFNLSLKSRALEGKPLELQDLL